MAQTFVGIFFFWVHVTKKCENNGKWHKRLKNRNFLEKIAKHRYTHYTVSNATSELGNDCITFAKFLQTYKLRDRNTVTGFSKRVTNNPPAKKRCLNFLRLLYWEEGLQENSRGKGNLWGKITQKVAALRSFLVLSTQDYKSNIQILVEVQNFTLVKINIFKISNS